MDISLNLNEANPTMYGSDISYDLFYLYLTLASRGTGILSLDGTKAVGTLDSPKAVEGIQWFNDYYQSM